MLRQKLLKKIIKTVSLGAGLLSLSTMEAGKCAAKGCEREAEAGSAFCNAHTPARAASPEIQTQTQERLIQEQQTQATETKQQEQAKIPGDLGRHKGQLAQELSKLKGRYRKLAALYEQVRVALHKSLRDRIHYSDREIFVAGVTAGEIGIKRYLDDINELETRIHTAIESHSEATDQMTQSIERTSKLIQECQELGEFIDNTVVVIGVAFLKAMTLPDLFTLAMNFPNPNAKPIDATKTLQDAISSTWEKWKTETLVQTYMVIRLLFDDNKALSQKQKEIQERNPKFPEIFCSCVASYEETFKTTIDFNPLGLYTNDIQSRLDNTPLLEDADIEQAELLLYNVLNYASNYNMDCFVLQKKNDGSLCGIVYNESIGSTKGKVLSAEEIKNTYFTIRDMDCESLYNGRAILWTIKSDSVFDAIKNSIWSALLCTDKEHFANYFSEVVEILSSWISKNNMEIAWNVLNPNTKDERRVWSIKKK